jgi:hypothetical protein
LCSHKNIFRHKIAKKYFFPQRKEG